MVSITWKDSCRSIYVRLPELTELEQVTEKYVKLKSVVKCR